MVLTRQQRFARNIKDNENRGLGGLAFITPGYSFPTHKQMDKFDKYKLPHDIDPALREVVIDLNDHGYTTGGSCQGHYKGSKGFISIYPNRSEVSLSVLKERLGSSEDAKKLAKALIALGESKKVVDPREVEQIIFKHGIKVTKYEPLIINTTRKNLKIHHAFIFQAIPGGR